jgi:MraZ protein
VGESGIVWNKVGEKKNCTAMAVIGKSVFVGEFLHQLDAKNRLCIPAKWRFPGDQENVYLALPNPLGCITIYPPKMVDRLEEKVSAVSLGDTRGQKTLAKLFSQADTFGCDKQGRITLSEKLIRHARVDKNILLAGSYATFNLWEPDSYHRYLDASTENDNPMSQLLQELGL